LRWQVVRVGARNGSIVDGGPTAAIGHKQPVAKGSFRAASCAWAGWVGLAVRSALRASSRSTWKAGGPKRTDDHGSRRAARAGVRWEERSVSVELRLRRPV